jgi:hypothetical protein
MNRPLRKYKELLGDNPIDKAAGGKTVEGWFESSSAAVFDNTCFEVWHRLY